MKFAKALDGSGVFINAFGSAIGNWGKDVRDDIAITEQEIARAIPRMHALGAKFVRIMSYKVLDQEDQLADERIRRLVSSLMHLLLKELPCSRKLHELRWDELEAHHGIG